MGRLIVVTGIPASGKSTVAAELARRRPRCVVVDGDVIREMVVSGGVEMSPEPSREAWAQLRLRYRASLAVAKVYLDAGFDVVFNENVIGPMLAELPSLIPCAEFHLVVLNPSRETLLSRDQKRDKNAYAQGSRVTFDWLHGVLTRETPALGLWLDNSEQTASETAGTILDRLDDSLVKPPD